MNTTTKPAPFKILTSEQPFPQVWALNPGSGFREPMDKPLDEIIADSVNRFIYEKGHRPKKLLVGLGRRTNFILSLAHGDFSPKSSACETFMGLLVEWVEGNEIEIE